jgi:hypothetical protein
MLPMLPQVQEPRVFHSYVGKMTKEAASSQKSHDVNNEGVSDCNVQVVL